MRNATRDRPAHWRQRHGPPVGRIDHDDINTLTALMNGANRAAAGSAQYV